MLSRKLYVGLTAVFAASLFLCDVRAVAQRSEVGFGGNVRDSINQAVKINSALSTHGSPTRWLSPRQKETLRSIEALSTAQRQQLSGMMFPTDQRQLASYQRQLLTKLGHLER